MLLNFWCALNTSFGGPLLAILTFGGMLSIGRAIISFPPPVVIKNDLVAQLVKNRRRRFVMGLGIGAFVSVLGSIVAYIWAFSLVRQNERACPTGISPAGEIALIVLFITFVIAAALSAFFSWQLAKLENDLAGVK